MKRKHKYAALCMAAVLGVTAAPAPVLAEGSYTETEKALFTNAVKALAEGLSDEMEDYRLLESGIREDISLRLEDSGKSILAMVSQADLTWFDELKLSSDISMADDVQLMDAGLYLNDTKICTLQYYFDLKNMEIYMKVPELRDGYIKMDYAKIMEEAAASEDADAEAPTPFNSPEFMKNYLRICSNLPDYVPETAVTESILTRYTELLFDYTEDVECKEETITIYDVSEDATLYEGQISSDKALAFATELLNTAKEDKELEDLLNDWNEKLPEADNLYQSFLDAIDSGLDSLTSDEDGDAVLLTSKLWTDNEGKTIGRSLETDNGTESVPLFTWQQTKNEEQRGYFLQIGPEEDAFSLTGSGQMTDGKLNGVYDFAVSGTPYVSIEVTDYDAEAAKSGSLYGSYKASLIASDDNPAAESLAGLALKLDAAAEDNTGTFDLALTSADIPLGILSLAVTEGAAIEKPDLADITVTYDYSDDAAMEEYTAGIALDTIIENLTAAGMPEELITEITSGSSEEEEIPLDLEEGGDA